MRTKSVQANPSVMKIHMRRPGGPPVTLSCSAPSAGIVAAQTMGGVRIVRMLEMKLYHRGSDKLATAIATHPHTIARRSDVSNIPHPRFKTWCKYS